MTNELTLENIRSGAFPSDAHAVGFLLGEIERLQMRLKRHEPVSLYNGHDIDWWKNEAERQKRYALIVESYLDRETLKEVLARWRQSSDGKETGNEPLQQRWVERSKEESDRMLADAFKTQQFQPDTSPLTHQEIFGAVHHHAAEIVKLTAAVPAQCAQGASRDASPAIGPPLCNCQDGECHGPDVAQAYGHLCRAEDEPKPFCAKHPNTAFADTGCPFCGTPPTSRTGE